MTKTIFKTMALAAVIAAGQSVVFAQKGTTSGPAQVQVINDAAQPVPVKITGTAVSEPFAFTTTFIMSALQAQNSSSYTVPVSKRLVIEHVSANCSTTSQTMKVRMAAIGGGTVSVAHTLMVDPVSFPAYQFAEASQAMKLYLNPGDTLHAWVYRSETASNLTCNFVFSGYQVNAQ